MIRLFVLMALTILTVSIVPASFATSAAGLETSSSSLVVLAFNKSFQLNDTKDALIGIANLRGHSQAILFIAVNKVDIPGNMACRGDLGSTQTNTWTFGAIDCHFNVPGYLVMTLTGLHDPNLRLAVSGGGPTQPTWATGNAQITVVLFLYQ